ncbi:RNA polymerase sigma factor [Streptomyces sp. NPDC054841]
MGGSARPRDRLSPALEAQLYEALREIRPRVLRAVTRMTRDYHLAEDITQETCLAVFMEFKKGTVFQKPVIVFAMVVARNKVYSHFSLMRTRMEQPSGEFADSTAGMLCDRADGLVYLELLAAVRAAIRDERQAKIWELKHVWGLKGTEIAAHFDISSATVTRELQRAEAKAKRSHSAGGE